MCPDVGAVTGHMEIQAEVLWRERGIETQAHPASSPTAHTCTEPHLASETSPIPLVSAWSSPLPFPHNPAGDREVTFHSLHALPPSGKFKFYPSSGSALMLDLGSPRLSFCMFLLFFDIVWLYQALAAVCGPPSLPCRLLSSCGMWA